MSRPANKSNPRRERELYDAIREVFGDVQRCAEYHNVSHQAVYQWLYAGHIPLASPDNKPRLRHHMAAVKRRGLAARYPASWWNSLAC